MIAVQRLWVLTDLPSLVRPAVKGSYIRHFRRIRDLAGIPEDFRPNYCLRDKVASRLLSSGATLDEVAYQLGHSPGSPMIRRYFRFLEFAQRGIADRTQRVMDEVLK